MAEDKKEKICDKVDILVKLDGKDFRLVCDFNNFILGRVATDKHGKEVLTQQKYYPSLESLMIHLCDLKVKAKAAETLDDLHRNIAEARDEIKGLYGSLTEEELKG